MTRASAGSRSGTVADASPLFPPECEDAEEARERTRSVVERSPRQLGYQRSRWTLSMLIEACGWLEIETEAGMSQQLDRLGLSYTRGQTHVPSPDPDFDAKRTHIQSLRERAASEDEKVACLYLDETTYYRRPTKAPSWSPSGECQAARAQPGSRGAPYRRVLGSFDHVTGQVWYHHDSEIDRMTLLEHLEQLDAAYPSEVQLFVVLDNAPFHFHVDVLAELEPQHWDWSYPRPGNWPDPEEAAAADGDIAIQLAPLPTYASWLNPIEKLWRWLKQEVIHMHDKTQRWPELQEHVDTFLEQWTGGPAPAVLDYTGLSSS